MLLIDEIDRADDDFEAFLLELLAGAERDDPRARHDHRHPPADHRPHLQPDPRPPRRRQAPLPVPLDRLPDARARGRDRPPPGARAPPRRWRCRSPTPSRGCATRDVQKPPGIAEAIDWLAALERARDRAPRRRPRRAHARVGAQVRRGPGGDPRGRPRAARARRWLSRRPAPPSGSRRSTSTCRRSPRSLGQRLRDAGVPVTPERSAAFARALTLVRPQSRRRLYWTARSVFVPDRAAGGRLRRRLPLGVRRPTRRPRAPTSTRPPPRRAADERPAPERPRRRPGGRERRRGGAGVSPSTPGDDDRSEREVDVPLAMASDEEVLADEELRRARAGRARAPLPADVAARARDPAAAHSPLRARPPRPAHRHAPDAAGQPAHRRRPDPRSRAAAAASSAAGW